MSKPESIYMWDNVDNTIQMFESRIDLINRKTNLYDPKISSQDNDDCSLKYSHIIGEFIPMKKHYYFLYGFKYHCTFINEQYYKLEGCIYSIRKNKMKTFPPFDNEFLPPSKNITLTDYYIMYPMKQRDICNYYPRCIISSGLLFDDIIIDIIKNNILAHPTEENDCLFT